MSKVYPEDFAYPAEAQRYRLVIANPCPYAQRTEITRRLLGLEEVVSLAIASPIKTKLIWDFSNQPDGRDPILDVEYVSDLYKNTDPDYQGPYSVPALVDLQTKQVVNSESLDIMKDFACRFQAFHKTDAPDLFLTGQEDRVEEWIEKIIKEVMGEANGAGYTRDQEEFDHHAQQYFENLSQLDQHLASNRYLLGDHLTAADIVLYTPLVRHDLIYAPVYGLRKHVLKDFPNLWRYMKSLYNLPAFKESTHFEDYLISQFSGKTGRIFFKREVVPMLPDMSDWET